MAGCAAAHSWINLLLACVDVLALRFCKNTACGTGDGHFSAIRRVSLTGWTTTHHTGMLTLGFLIFNDFTDRDQFAVGDSVDGEHAVLYIPL